MEGKHCVMLSVMLLLAWGLPMSKKDSMGFADSLAEIMGGLSNNRTNDQTARLISLVNTLKTDLTAQGENAEKQFESLQRQLAKQAADLDLHLTSLHTEHSELIVLQNVTNARLSNINMQLHGRDIGSDIIREEELSILNTSPESATTLPVLFPNASDGSVMQVLSVLWIQLNALKHAQLADAPIHSQRAGPRLDVELVDYIIQDLAATSGDASSLDPTCPFCNQTLCRQVAKACLLDGKRVGLPPQLQPDTAHCWGVIDSYCGQVPGSHDPGCGCQSSERCWDTVGLVGRCPLYLADGSRRCNTLPALRCKEFFESDVSKLFQSPAYSPADELLLVRLREFRKKLVDSSAPVAQPEESVNADAAALIHYIQSIQEIAISLSRRRSEIIQDANAIAAMIQTKSDMLAAAESSKKEVLVRMALETQAIVERRSQISSQIRVLDQVLSILGSIVGPDNRDVLRSKEGAARSCQHLKQLYPDQPSGVYWVTLGNPLEPTRVFCDMTTDGGGWTLLWKNVGGAVQEGTQLQHASNFDLLNAQSRVDVVTPTYMERKAQVHKRAYEYFANRPNQEWIKFMTLYRGRTDAFTSQRVLVDMGRSVFSKIFTVAEGCHPITDEPIKVYSSHPESDASSTDYYMGESRVVVNRQGESFGLANSGTPDDQCVPAGSSVSFADQCNAMQGKRIELERFDKTNAVVCDFESLRTLSANGNLTVAASWQIVRHLFSYLHKATTARQANRCMYRCWEQNDDALYNDVFVWAARGKCPKHQGLACSMHGECVDGVCVCSAGFYGDACENRVDCGSFPKAENVSIKCTGQLFEDSCVFGCENGYFLNEDAVSAHCRADGTWSSTQPLCKPRDCGKFNASTLGTHTSLDCSGTYYTDSCNVVCELGYSPLVKDSRLTCGVDGKWKWTGEPSRCSRIECAPPAKSPNGDYTCTGPVEEIGTRCEFRCDSGFVLQGSQVRTCEASGSYSGNEAHCEVIACPAYTIDTNVIAKCQSESPLVFGNAAGDVCEFSCPSTHFLRGALSIRCLADGSWIPTPLSAASPACVPSDPCATQVCPAEVPTCLSGQFVAPKSQWAGCCFDKALDCMAFEFYVTLALSVPVELSPSTVDGTVNINFIRQALATIANVRNTDVGVLYVSSPVIHLYIAPSADSSKESDVNRILEATKVAVVDNPVLLDAAFKQAGLTVNGAVGIISYPSIAARTPTETGSFADFNDLDGRSGWVMGPFVVHRGLPLDNSTTRFVLYFGDGKGVSRDNRVGDYVAAADIDVANTNPFVTINVPQTQVPLSAKSWIVFAGGPFAEAFMGFSIPLVETVRQQPGVINGTLSFADEDPRTGFIRGSITVTTTQPSQATSDYVVYFGREGAGQENKVGVAIAEGVALHPTTVMTLPSSLEIPHGADRLIAFARNVDIEASTGIASVFSDLSP